MKKSGDLEGAVRVLAHALVDKVPAKNAESFLFGVAEACVKLAMLLRSPTGRVEANAPVGVLLAKKGINWRDQPLGQMSDSNLAKQIGCAKSSVGKARRRLGIPAYVKGRKSDSDSDSDSDKGLGEEAPQEDGVAAYPIGRPVPVLAHCHKCPICSKFFPCRDACKVDLQELSPEYVPLGEYRTCTECLERLSRERGGREAQPRNCSVGVGW